MKKQHWQDWANLVLGLWVIASPWTIAHIMASPENPAGAPDAAMWNHYLVGIAVAIVAVIALFAFAAWEEWANIALGAWLFLSHLLLGFSGSAALTWNAMIIGALVVGFAGWVLNQEQRGQQLGKQV
jgi:hypothetical protein